MVLLLGFGGNGLAPRPEGALQRKGSGERPLYTAASTLCQKDVTRAFQCSGISWKG
jgi:hypothetical protein